MSSDLSWLTARPIAHRGYHDAKAGRIENTPSSIAAAIEHAFAIEVDLQETADGEALVFHDYTLERLTFETGMVKEKTFAQLSGVIMRGTEDKLWRLQDLLRLVAGRVPLVIEIKSRSERDSPAPFVRAIADQILAYSGRVAVKSFDPDILQALREYAPQIPRGIVADATRNEGEWRKITRMERFILRHMLHLPRTRPHFISYCIKDLPALTPSLLRRFKDYPLITWTVRTQEDRRRAAVLADQIVFEGFDADQVVNAQR